MPSQFDLRRFRPFRDRVTAHHREKEKIDSEVASVSQRFQEMFREKYGDVDARAIYGEVGSGDDPESLAAREAGRALLEEDLRAAGVKDPRRLLERVQAAEVEAAELAPELERRASDVAARLRADPAMRRMLERVPATSEVREAIDAVGREAVLDDDPSRAADRVVYAVHQLDPSHFTADDADLLFGAEREALRVQEEAQAEQRRRYAEADMDEINAAMAKMDAEHDRQRGIRTKRSADGNVEVEQPTPTTAKDVDAMLADLRAAGVTHLDNGQPIPSAEGSE